MKVAMLPRSPWVRDNPYLDLLEEGLHQHGVETVNDPNDSLSWRWAIAHRHDVQILHLHWLSQHYTRANAARSALALALFAAKLALVHRLGYRIVWTVHNLQPHEQRYPRLDRLCWAYVAKMADRVIVHSQATGAELAARYRRAYTGILPLPNYIGVYPDPPDCAEARRRLGLAGSGIVFLCFGAVRRYKGFQDAVVAFRQFSNADARLVIAGLPREEELARELRDLAGDDPRICLRLDFIPNAEVSAYLAAADVLLLPFRRIDTTSSAVLAMSLKRPVIATALGSVPELVPPGTGLVYPAHDPAALLNQLDACTHLDLAAMGQRAYAFVAPNTPYEVARQHLQVYLS